jgi:hypothetical protein
LRPREAGFRYAQLAAFSFVFPKKLITFKPLNTKTKPLMLQRSKNSHSSKNCNHPAAAKPGNNKKKVE